MDDFMAVKNRMGKIFPVFIIDIICPALGALI